VLKLSTCHLSHFDDYRKATQIIGNEYIPILKSQYYSLMSTKIATKAISLGKLKTDGRIHTMLPIPSGHGKFAIKTANKRIIESICKSCEEPTSLHPEQLVGKVSVHKKKETTYEIVQGYFSRDYLLLEEAIQFMESEDLLYQESRKYLRQALDSYPNNTITKRSVDVDFENQLKYEPSVCVTILLQPLPIDERRVYEGDLRRGMIVYVDLLEIDQTAALTERILSEDEDAAHFVASFSDFLSSLPDEIEDFTFSKNEKELIARLGNLLIGYGQQYSEKIVNYVQYKKFTIQELLVKLSVVQAYIANRTELTARDVELAFTDLFEFLTLEFEYIERHIIGMLDYGKGWQGALGEDQKCLQWLWDKEAVSFEKSTVKIEDYVKMIAETCSISVEAARKRYYNHKEKGWVEGKQVGKHSSKIWLTFTPQFKRITSRDKVTEVYETYVDILKKYNLTDNLPPLPSSELPHNTKENSNKGDTTLVPPLTSEPAIEIPEGGLKL